ncbi:DUF6438 domain-containing protein [Nitrospirillum pindoramense]|uniref:DUF6438 domain-containing protein n=1 Tax=Nitrospirillum amazonense TaxID=28077 RepID=A0A560HD71_9PROT|nr:ankyrin repeat domain-containing protein [Nitrospirillum amazonense]TWB44335.1 hypothetical protein FBZ90_103242 [Nitrospirillum amazonense]
MPQAPRRVTPLLVTALLPLLSACALHRDTDDTIGLSSTTFFGHLTNQADIREPSLAEATTVELKVRANEDGRVTAVTAPPQAHAYGVDWPQKADDPAVKTAVDAARRWRLRPLLYRGHPVPTQATVAVRVLPAERWAQPDAPFPEVDWSKLRISLSRDVPFGGQYTVTVVGDGHVVFDSPAQPDMATFTNRALLPRGLFLPGRHEDSIDPALVRALVAKFQAARFFGVAPEYKARSRESPFVTLTLDTSNGSRRVVDYIGRDVGLPQSVKDLEDEVDRIAGTARWTRGTPGVIGWLAATGFDFKSDMAAVLAVSDYGWNAQATVLEFMNRGLDLEKTSTADRPRIGPVGIMLMRQALSKGQTTVFARLMAGGWLARLQPGDADRMFALAGANCDAGFARAAVAAGLAVDGPAAGLENGPNGTALITLATRYSCASEQARLDTTAQLLKLGADPNRRDEDGRTILFHVHTLDLLELLLSHGADATLRDPAGNSAALYSQEDAITLRLLEAGASPEGRDEDGHTLPERAALYTMPATARWLAAHGQTTAPGGKK